MEANVPRSALLCHLDPALQAELRAALSDPQLNFSIYTCSCTRDCRHLSASCSPDVLFCAMSEDFQELLSSVKDHVPVIVVVRVPDTREWIAAMEAGAADYCAPPFESAQLRWMLSTASQGGSLLRAAG